MCYNISGDKGEKNDFINMRINGNIKENSEKILNNLGLSLSAAIDIFLNQVINNRGIPFDIKLPNEEEYLRREEIAKAINKTGGVDLSPKLDKIITLYAKGDIDYDVAIYAIKREFINE